MSTWSAGDVSTEENKETDSPLKHMNHESSNYLDAQDYNDPSWSSHTSYVTISDGSDQSTPNANSSADDTFYQSNTSLNSYATAFSTLSSTVDGGGESEPSTPSPRTPPQQHQQEDQEIISKKKKTKITLVYAPEKSSSLSSPLNSPSEQPSSSSPAVTPTSEGKEIRIRSNYTPVNEIDSLSTTQEITLSSSYTNNDDNNLSDKILEFKDPPNNHDDYNNNNNNDSKYIESNNNISFIQQSVPRQHQEDISSTSLEGIDNSLSSEPSENNDQSINSSSNNHISNDNIDATLSNYQSSLFKPIISSESDVLPVKNEVSTVDNPFIDSKISTSNITDDHNNRHNADDGDDASIQPNLCDIIEMNSGQDDDEIVETVVNISDEYRRGTINRFNDNNNNHDHHHHVPAYLDRCSPAQIVAVTGGAPSDIIRNIEEDLDDDEINANNVEIVEVLKQSNNESGSSFSPGNTTVNNNNNHSTLSTSSNSNVVRHRGHTLDTSKSQRPVTINIDLRVVSELTPSTPEEVDASSELVFSNFMLDRYMLEVSASAQASSSASTSSKFNNSLSAKASASISITDTTQPDDPVSHQFQSLPRAEPNSVEAIVARNLAEIGDEINRVYGPRLDRMIKLLPVEECPLEMFYNVARVLFTRGPTNWGQVITLFYFGYRLVVQRVKNGIANAFYQVCRCLINFCRQINIFVWIAQQGGWRILQFLRRGRAYDNDGDDDTVVVDSVNHSNSVDVISRYENQQQPHDSVNEQHSMLFNDPSFLVPLVLTSTGFVVIAVALWIYLRRR
ncbi:unnamed protein product [Trichobilharzia szidati]|nr:unnamed protein product [Trichobilharzia szidati]